MAVLLITVVFVCAIIMFYLIYLLLESRYRTEKETFIELVCFVFPIELVIILSCYIVVKAFI